MCQSRILSAMQMHSSNESRSIVDFTAVKNVYNEKVSLKERIVLLEIDAE